RPKCPLLKALPPKTHKIVIENKKAGKKASIYKSLGLTKQIKNILSNYQLKDTFVPSEIFAKLPDELQALVKTPARITDRFTEELAEYVKKTGEKYKNKGKAGRPEEYYKLIKKIEID